MQCADCITSITVAGITVVGSWTPANYADAPSMKDAFIDAGMPSDLNIVWDGAKIWFETESGYLEVPMVSPQACLLYTSPSPRDPD